MPLFTGFHAPRAERLQPSAFLTLKKQRKSDSQVNLTASAAAGTSGSCLERRPGSPMFVDVSQPDSRGDAFEGLLINTRVGPRNYVISKV